MGFDKHLMQARAFFQQIVGTAAPVVEVACHHHRRVAGQVLPDHAAQHVHLQAAVGFEQAQVHAKGMYVAPPLGQRQHAVKQAAPLGAADGDVAVFGVRDGELGQHGIAMVAVGVHRVAAIGVLRPNAVG